MTDKLPKNHSASAHKDKVGQVMHEFKRGQLHSGTGKKGKKGPVVKNREQAIAIGLNYSQFQQLQTLGYSEDAAWAFAEMAAKLADEGPLSDIDSQPGKQKGKSGRKKGSPQEMATTFPTLPKQAPGNNDYSDGAMIKARKGSCPTGTRAVGAGYCKNSKPGKRQYFEVEKGKSCPPGSRSAGSGRCRVDFVEAAAPDLTGQCDQKKKREQRAEPRTGPEQAADRQRASEMKGKDQIPSGVRQEAAKKAAETREKCKKTSPSTTQATQPNTQNNAVR